MTFILPEGQSPGGGWILPGRNPAMNPGARTPAQGRVNTGVSGNARLDMALQIDKIAPAVITTEAPAGVPTLSPPGIAPTTEGRVTYYAWDGTQLIVAGTDVEVKNPLPDVLAVNTLCLVGTIRTDPTSLYVLSADMVSNVASEFYTVRPQGSLNGFLTTTSFTASPGDLAICDVSGGSITVSLPNGVDLDDDIEIGVAIGTAPGGNTVTLTATGTGAEIITKEGAVTSVALFVKGDYLRVKKSVGLGTNSWVVVDDVRAGHRCELSGSDSLGQTVSDNTVTVASLPITVVDNAGLATPSDTITIRRTGTYAVSIGWGVSTGGVVNRQLAIFNVNGGTTHDAERTVAMIPGTFSGIVYASTAFIVELTAGDTCQLELFVDTSDSSSKSAGTVPTQRPHLSVREMR